MSKPIITHIKGFTLGKPAQYLSAGDEWCEAIVIGLTDHNVTIRYGRGDEDTATYSLLSPRDLAELRPIQ